MVTGNNDIAMTIIGVGPGDPQMLTLRAQQAIRAADLVVGFRTVLNVVEQWAGDAELCPMSYRDQEQVLDYAQEQVRAGKTCVVCAWGDLNVSARELIERVQRRAGRVELIPGVSSIQFAAARTGIYMEESIFVTLHKRADTAGDLDELRHHMNEGLRNIILLPRPFDLMPPLIAANLVEAGVPGDRPVIVYQRLTFDDEQAWRGTLDQCAQLSDEFSDLSIMVLPRPSREPD